MFGTYKKGTNSIIFIDIDDTICDTRKAVLDIYNILTDSKSVDTYESKRYVDFCPMWSDAEIGNLFKFGAKDIYQKAEVIPGAKEGIAKLISLGFDIRLVSLNYAESVAYKQEWVNNNFPMLKDKLYIGTCVGGNKDIFKGYAIIDDDIKNIKTNSSQYPILLDVHGVYKNELYAHKYSSWKDLVDKF